MSLPSLSGTAALDVERIQVSATFPCLAGFVWFDASCGGVVLFVRVKGKA